MINHAFRVSLLLSSICLLILLVYYVATHADPMANVLLGTQTQEKGTAAADNAAFWRAAGSVLLPVGILLSFVAGIVLLALHAQTRGVTEFERLMDGVSRIRRDAVGVSRTRSISFVVEESLERAKRSFALQLWVGRTLFIGSLALLAAFIGYSTLKGTLDLLSAALAGGSILSFLVSSVVGTSDQIGNALADLTQLHLIVMTTAERLGVLSEYAYSLLEDRGNPGRASKEMPVILEKLKAVADDAAHQIQEYAEPRGLPTGD